MNRTRSHPSAAGAEPIRAAARRLFCERGVEGVTVREIAEAAGQKNHGAVSYYFGSKEALVREIVIEGASLIGERIEAALDALDAAGGPSTPRQVIEAMVRASVDFDGPDGEADTYMRLFHMLDLTHKELLLSAVGGLWNAPFQRCLALLRDLMPDMSLNEKNQRLIFMSTALGSVLALREAALADRTKPHPMWASETTLRQLIASLEAMLTAPAA